ncbi:hypothetical protein [Microbacterium sp.]|uniref:hypothetical protein n=1 Tax=Microbacterium sp. TaxID=51671 RepID=UPI002E2EAB6D|nr:hypothetical protein [Microbacterium sp.]HEX5730113.1 hypothetical protein [Microbacterium sp.]
MTDVPSKRPAFEPAAELLKPTTYDPDMQRPPSTVAGVVLVLLRVVAGIIVMIATVLQWPTVVRDLDVSFDDVEATPQLAGVALIVLMVVLGSFLLLDAILAFFILAGHNWARVIVMTFSAIAISSSFVQWWAEGQEITITTTLLTLGLDILILLALSSRSAAAYARRHERG